MTQADSRSLTRIVAELTTLGSLADTRHGGNVDDISWFSGLPNGLGRREEREEGKSGKVVGSRVDLVGGEPEADTSKVEVWCRVRSVEEETSAKSYQAKAAATHQTSRSSFSNMFLDIASAVCSEALISAFASDTP
jgi:hypothetical protein